MSKNKAETTDVARAVAGSEALRLPPEEYLERYGVTAYMKDVVTLLLENRPDKPLEFMADYFSNALQGRTAVARSYRYIRLTRRNRQAFLDNLAAAYSVLARQGEATGGGLTGANYMQLIKMLCQDFPNDIVVSLTQVLDKKETDIISFPVFVAGVNACLVYEEFFEHAEHIFNACDVEGKGVVDQETFFSILRQMNHSTADIEHETEGWTIPSYQLIDSAKTIMEQQGGSTSAITYKDFIRTIIKLFISRGEPYVA